MPVATKSRGKTPSETKTSFVRKHLQNNPQANAKAVNEAWAAAGMKGTISHPVVSDARKELGLIGKQPATTSKAAKPKTAPPRSKTASSPGKTMFVKEFLHDHPRGNVVAANEAWRAAGFEGTISLTLVDKIRSSLGLTGNLRGQTTKSKPAVTAKTAGTPRKETPATNNVQPRANSSIRTVVLNELETEIDRLIFRAMAIGNLTDFEDLLRQARRLLYGALSQR